MNRTPRQQLEDEIERLIEIVDCLDDDPDLEATGDDEPDADAEPNAEDEGWFDPSSQEAR